MTIHLTGKHIEVTEGLRSYVYKKLERVKFYFPHLIDINVVMEVEKLLHKIEITIKADGKIFHSEFKTQDMYSAIDGLIDRVEKQIKRYKDKLHNFKPNRVSTALAEKYKDDSDFVFTKIREIMPKPMSDEEAILQLQKSEFRFHIYKKANVVTEEDFKKLAEKDQPYPKSVVIKESDKDYVIITKKGNTWVEESFILENGRAKNNQTPKDYVIEEKSIEEAVQELLETQKNYVIFYDTDHKDLTIVYKRKNNTFGMIISNNSQN